ncbi:hypothetical protein [Occallatibacter riparius]|uniref:Uncharacterized protein n=1 Tax=Occallatibacter riparius TaxID=1002689 RepID=A0A9J7BZ48_9BACT|nr:hypothetical protein [Occallatibacter riparius]UWZ86838.1 hypothetical protein MOP44_13020 [Occallatibacter riparius]
MPEELRYQNEDIEIESESSAHHENASLCTHWKPGVKRYGSEDQRDQRQNSHNDPRGNVGISGRQSL